MDADPKNHWLRKLAKVSVMMVLVARSVIHIKCTTIDFMFTNLQAKKVKKRKVTMTCEDGTRYIIFKWKLKLVAFGAIVYLLQASHRHLNFITYFRYIKVVEIVKKCACSKNGTCGVKAQGKRKYQRRKVTQW